MLVALCRRGLGRVAGHSRRARRHDDHRLGMACSDTAVDTFLIIPAVAGERGDRAVYLVEQGTDLRGPEHAVEFGVPRVGGHRWGPNVAAGPSGGWRPRCCVTAGLGTSSARVSHRWRAAKGRPYQTPSREL